MTTITHPLQALRRGPKPSGKPPKLIRGFSLTPSTNETLNRMVSHLGLRSASAFIEKLILDYDSRNAKR